MELIVSFISFFVLVGAWMILPATKVTSDHATVAHGVATAA